MSCSLNGGKHSWKDIGDGYEQCRNCKKISHYHKLSKNEDANWDKFIIDRSRELKQESNS